MQQLGSFATSSEQAGYALTVSSCSGQNQRLANERNRYSSNDRMATAPIDTIADGELILHQARQVLLSSEANPTHLETLPTDQLVDALKTLRDALGHLQDQDELPPQQMDLLGALVELTTRIIDELVQRGLNPPDRSDWANKKLLYLILAILLTTTIIMLGRAFTWPVTPTIPTSLAMPQSPSLEFGCDEITAALEKARPYAETATEHREIAEVSKCAKLLCYGTNTTSRLVAVFRRTDTALATIVATIDDGYPAILRFQAVFSGGENPVLADVYTTLAELADTTFRTTTYKLTVQRLDILDAAAYYLDRLVLLVELRHGINETQLSEPDRIAANKTLHEAAELLHSAYARAIIPATPGPEMDAFFELNSTTTMLPLLTPGEAVYLSLFGSRTWIEQIQDRVRDLAARQGILAICILGALLLVGMRYPDCYCTIPDTASSPIPTHAPPPSPPPPPVAHLPPSVLPFIDRIAYQLPERLLSWTGARPVHPARRRKPPAAEWESGDNAKDARPAAARLSAMARDAWAGKDSITRYSPLGTWITQWVLHTGEVDRLARAEWRTIEEATAAGARARTWSWAAPWRAVMRRRRQPRNPTQSPLWDICAAAGNQSRNPELLEKSKQIKDAAVGQQESLLASVSELAAIESSALTRELIQPALKNATTWLNAPSTIRRRSWSDPTRNDDTGRGRGEVFYLHSPRIVMGRQIPSDANKQALDILMHDFVDALVIELIADAIIALIETYDTVCEQERDRGYYTVFTTRPDPELDDFSLPRLQSRVLQHLAQMPRPFTALKEDDKLKDEKDAAEGTRATLDYLLGTLGKPPSNRKGKISPQLAFWARVLRDSGCLFVKGKASQRVFVEGGTYNNDGGDIDEAAQAVWSYWQEGVDVRWRTTETTRSYLDVAMGFTFDLGGTSVTETKVCRALLADGAG
ncbi:hypothetical protein Tdes44962_MAKER08136 [Teratosphaeria destructans]|uniref:Uncharacterized protein n=1 Tax=Teratosphaeria destructans TaxID=418781 RepID=A0A9W7SX99_9PEZI|nr:hypothetical protein Tdes44962_MAKER08136 [Teratosphaeria destructans]